MQSNLYWRRGEPVYAPPSCNCLHTLLDNLAEPCDLNTVFAPGVGYWVRPYVLALGQAQAWRTTGWMLVKLWSLLKDPDGGALPVVGGGCAEVARWVM